MDFFDDTKTKIIIIIILITLNIVSISLQTYNVINKSNIEYKTENIVKEPENKEDNKDENINEESNNTIYIDIKGAVKSPGVYEVNNDSKVIDIINLAGGLNKNASTKYINLSKKLNNESVIYIYTNNEINTFIKEQNKEPLTECKCETENIKSCIDNKSSIIEKGQDTITNQDKKEDNSKININTASKDQLTSLTGIGDAKANAIIDYRNKNGNFKAIEEIKNVSGISDSLYEKIKDNITI